MERVALDQLKPADWNPRSIKEERFLNLVETVKADPGYLELRPILALPDGTIYAGNMRFRAAQHLGYKTVPVEFTDIPLEQAKARAIRDNRQWGQWDSDLLSIMVDELDEAGTDLDFLGLTKGELDFLRPNPDLEMAAYSGPPQRVPAVNIDLICPDCGNEWTMSVEEVLSIGQRQGDSGGEPEAGAVEPADDHGR